MPPTLASFDLERWVRKNGRGAQHVIGGSGAPQASLGPVLPASAAERERIWATHVDDLLEAAEKAIARTYRVPSDSVLVTQGASEADFVAVLGLAGPGAHVVIERPAYYALLEPARALGCRVSRVLRKFETGFRLEPAAVRRAIRADTRLVVLARPHNPTGQLIPDDHLVSIAESAERVGAYVLVDEVFAEATTVGDRPSCRLHDRILTVNSLTKCLGYGPLHMGWILAPGRLRQVLERAKMHVRPLNPTIELGLVPRVMARRREILATTRRSRTTNLRTLAAFAADHPEFAWWRPDHGTTTVLRLPAKWRDDVAFARRLLKKAGVMVAPGSHVELPGWIRVGLAGDPKKFAAGIEALERFLA